MNTLKSNIVFTNEMQRMCEMSMSSFPEGSHHAFAKVTRAANVIIKTPEVQKVWKEILILFFLSLRYLYSR